MPATLERTTLTLEEWTARAIELFGPEPWQWRFICPVCGHVQKAEYFRPFINRGASANSAYQECIGRYTGAREMKPKGQGPCNYVGYGLFRLSPVRVSVDGKMVHAFAFDEGAAP